MEHSAAAQTSLNPKIPARRAAITASSVYKATVSRNREVQLPGAGVLQPTDKNAQGQECSQKQE